MITYTVVLNGRRHDISVSKDDIRMDYRHVCKILLSSKIKPPSLIRYVKYRIHDILINEVLITSLHGKGI
jgi:hypothetical protein